MHGLKKKKINSFTLESTIFLSIELLKGFMAQYSLAYPAFSYICHFISCKAINIIILVIFLLCLENKIVLKSH